MKILKCLAWVIGINHYEHYPKLHAAVNDAKEFAEKLRTLHFDVIESIDEGRGCTYDDVLNKEQLFLDKLFAEKVDVALVYFAGHGCMVNKEDCLLLSDTDSYQYGSVKARNKSIILNSLCKDMNANGDQMNIFIVDACRVIATETRGVLQHDGFGQNTKLPFQSIFAYSTSPDTTASEGLKHSLFTHFLLENVMEKNLPIEMLFKLVRQKMRNSGHDQISQELTSLVDTFSFNYGQMEDGAVLEYSEDALADYAFVSSNSTFEKCVELFKSYDYYRQQDALSIFHKNYKGFTEDEKFVIGRNILQAAFGGCWECEKEISYNRLSLYQKDKRNAVLDGILYEMYFNSSNEFRDEVKGIELLPNVDKLSAFDTFKSSFVGIKNVLAKYRDRLNYIPGEKLIYPVKLELESLGKDELDTPMWNLHRVVYNDTDIMQKLHLRTSININDLRVKLCQYLAIPASLLKINMPNNIGEMDILKPEIDMEIIW